MKIDSFLSVDSRRRTKIIRLFLCDKSGAALVEYALLVGLIALVAIVGVTAVGTNITAQFAKISCKIANPSAACTEAQ